MRQGRRVRAKEVHTWRQVKLNTSIQCAIRTLLHSFVEETAAIVSTKKGSEFSERGSPMPPWPEKQWIVVMTSVYKALPWFVENLFCFVPLECSREYEVAKQLKALDAAAFFHCLPNGNYDKLQCIAQACFCINPADQSLASNKEPITNVEDLPCCKYSRL